MTTTGCPFEISYQDTAADPSVTGTIQCILDASHEPPIAHRAYVEIGGIWVLVSAPNLG